jgi:hypothetical protein
MPKSDRITLHPVTFTAATSTLPGGNPMKLAHISLAFAIASSAIVPFTLSAQAGAAQKAPPAAAQKAPAASAATDQAKCKDGTMYSVLVARRRSAVAHGVEVGRATKGCDREVQRRHLLYEGRAQGRVHGPQGRRGVAEEGIAAAAERVASARRDTSSRTVYSAVLIHTFCIGTAV